MPRLRNLWRQFNLGVLLSFLSLGFIEAQPLHELHSIRPLNPRQATQFLQETAQRMHEIDNEVLSFRIGEKVVTLEKSGNTFWIGTPNHIIQLDGDPLQQRILTDYPICIFDLELPFLNWKNFRYEGIGTLSGRQVQRFTLLPPEEFSGKSEIASVAVAIDASFGYPIGWTAYNASGKIIREFRVRSFKQNSKGEWFVKRVQFYIPNESPSKVFIDWLQEE